MRMPSHFAGVQSAAVNVICELARRNPKNYLSLAPLFFKLMTSSTNNWVLIKIIKLASTPLVPTGVTGCPGVPLGPWAGVESGSDPGRPSLGCGQGRVVLLLLRVTHWFSSPSLVL